MIRFSLFGAAGFGVGGAIDISSMLVPIPLPVSVLVGGAVGGASLGLALRDWRKAVILALLGAFGLVAGVFATLSVGSYFNYSSVAMGALVGAVIGASLGVAFLDWRVILGLAVAGAVGFGAGLLAGDFLRALFPVLRGLVTITVAGIVGGASLGAALGYLQTRNLTEERRPGVR